jgi:hypothetical protein
LKRVLTITNANTPNNRAKREPDSGFITRLLTLSR